MQSGECTRSFKPHKVRDFSNYSNKPKVENTTHLSELSRRSFGYQHEKHDRWLVSHNIQGFYSFKHFLHLHLMVDTSGFVHYTSLIRCVEEATILTTISFVLKASVSTFVLTCGPRIS